MLRGEPEMGKVRLVGRQPRSEETQANSSERFADVLATVRKERVRRERTRVKTFSLQKQRAAD